MYIRKKEDKGAVKHQNGVESLYSFSFYTYFDSKYTGFADLQAVNYETLNPGVKTKFQKIKDHDVLIFVDKGDLCLHKPKGEYLKFEQNDAVLIAGAEQGIEVAFENAEKTKKLSLYMFYFKNSYADKPSIKHVFVPPHEGWKSILFPTIKSAGHLMLPQKDIRMLLLHEDLGSEVVYPIKKGRKIWIEVLSGEVELEEGFYVKDIANLRAGDALGLNEMHEKLHFEAITAVKLILVDMPE